MRTIIAIIAIAFFMAPGTALADNHLVSANHATSRLAAAAAESRQARFALGRLLESPTAHSAAGALGANAERLQAGLAALDDQELRDLAARAEALGIDPAAGENWDTNDILTVFLVVVIVMLVFDAV